MNLRAQTGMSMGKQLQIQQFIVDKRIDICHLQESHIDEDTFSTCDYITSNFEIFANNSLNKYGTASLVRSDIQIQNIGMDQEGRVIVFDVARGFTCGNFYLPSGNGHIPRSKREKYSSEIIPQLMIHHLDAGIAGGDFNCIIHKKDATKNPEQKISPSLRRLTETFSWEDSYRSLYPTNTIYSRYYESDRHGEGASRIDRAYHWGGVEVLEASYHSLAFSDHMAHVVKYELPTPINRILSPKSRPCFKVKPSVVTDPIFQARLEEKMREWQIVKDIGVDVLIWWEEMVKPGIKYLAKQRGRELNKERRGLLNLLIVRQAYLTKKVVSGRMQSLEELKHVHLKIEKWYNEESNKIILQTQVKDLEVSEKVRIYHHSLHQKSVKKSSILRLQTEEGLKEGHKACAEYLEQSVASHLLQPANLDPVAQQVLLAEVQKVFTQEDNEMMCKLPEKQEVLKVLQSCTPHAAPGTDGLTAFLYKQHWNIIGDSLTAVVQAVFRGKKPTASQRTSMMVFGTKPKKKNSEKPSDKRKISLLNVDFKIMSGVEAARLRSTMTRTVSPHQLVAGTDRRIHHGIALARDAIQAAGKSREGCGILDTDLISAFCNMVLMWALKVMEAKGLCQEACSRLLNLYTDNYSIVVVNNVLGKCVKNTRMTIRQGDKISMEIFTFGIDPVLIYLESRLKGILIYKMPVQGPMPAPTPPPYRINPRTAGRQAPRAPAPATTLPPLELRYKLIGYCDDLKPSITSMNEFIIVDQAMTIFEKSSGCMMHRDPTSGKCKFLPLGRWKGTLTQEDLPCNFFKLSDHLDMLGVTLKSTYTATRKSNGDELQSRIQNIIGPWRTGRHMALTSRPHLINSTVLSKIYHRCTTGDLRVCDTTNITKQVKSWLYSDLLERPQIIAQHRNTEDGGLGLQNIETRALSFLISSFLETSINRNFQHNLYHEALLRYYVLDETIPKPDIPPYFRGNFFPTIRRLHSSILGIKNITVKMIYRFLIEDITMTETQDDSPRSLIPLRVELASPDTDWPHTWKLARQRPLGPQLSSFLFKLLHNILPTGERVARILLAASPNCTRCAQDPPVIETLYHSLVTCPANTGATAILINCLSQYDPNITAQKILTLNFQVETSLEIPITWVIASYLFSIWSLRSEKKQITQYKIRSDLEASCRILSETRFINISTSVREILNSLFP